MYLTSVHGACVELNGHGVLLCGDSGAGKSTLAYACARSGWKFLCDDATCLIRDRPGRLVTGNPYQMRFRESARSLFPELAEQPSTLRATGEQAVELPTAKCADIATISQSTIDYLVFLNRSDAPSQRLLSFPTERALQWLGQVACFGEPHVRESHLANLKRLMGARVLEMRYRDTASAVRLLTNLVGAGSAARRTTLAAAGAPPHV